MPETNIEFLSNKKKWYKRKWLVALVSFVSLAVLLFVGLFAYQFYTVYYLMKTGAYITGADLTIGAPYQMSSIVDEMSPWVGKKDAKVVIVQFGDFNCAKTKAEVPIFKEVISKYQSKVKFIWRNFPIIADNSVELASAAICADKQNRFWDFHWQLFERQGEFGSRKAIEALASSLGFKMDAFNDCLENKLTQAQVKKDYYSARDGEAAGTPTFFINGYKLQGTISVESWDEIIQKFLKFYEKDNGN